MFEPTRARRSSRLAGRIAEENRGPEPSRIPIVFSVPDLKAAHARALSAGCSWLDAHIRRQPTGLPLGGRADVGERGFALRDPSGNAIVFVEEG